METLILYDLEVTLPLGLAFSLPPTSSKKRKTQFIFGYVLYIMAGI